MSGVTSSLQLGAGAMHAHSGAMAVVAHNVANVSTAGFAPQRAALATGPAGQGVRFSAVLQAMAGQFSPAGSVANAVYDVTSGLPPSGTDLSSEISRMISTQHAYEANAQVVRTSDALLGRLLNIKA